MKNKFILFTILLGFFGSITAQKVTENVILGIKIPSTVLIKGTSTLHDWESVVQKTDVAFTVNNLNDVHIETLIVEVDVLSIKSGKKVMDKLTYKALKADEYPIIKFLFKKGEIIKEDANFIDIKLVGDLSIAGVTKNVAVNTKINKLGESIMLKGAHKLKMTDFGITPPKALLGTIKTGDEITIEFNLTFE
ncbi:YceI family protein [uncultured Polaribacter sp.]|uniref:YceI family protein n=1 Tax=uncultured Polaribacter sp. TaxID=174711 RepID=UPI00260CC281|nr:YceI family protein [uncultured Polaribacter sp.]